jgi:uncharacterized membrane protein YdbT with pleckstrin-like domain
MRDTLRYLIPSEELEVETRRHWASLLPDFLRASIALTISVALIVYGNAQALATVGALGVIGSLAWLLWTIWDWYRERFVVTDKRVLLISGLLTKRVAIMPLNRVTDLTYERSPAGRVLGYGVFVMESAGQQQALSRVDYLPEPDRLYQQVSELLFGRHDSVPARAARRPEPVDEPFDQEQTEHLPDP